VGDGDAAVIENPGGQTAVIDTGPDKSAAAVVASAISQRLGRQVDLMIVTSTDIRSIGGAADLIPQIRLKGPVILPTDIQTLLAQGGESARSLIAAIKKTGEPAVEWSDYAAKSQARILGSVPAHVAFLKPIRPREGQYYAAMAVKVDFGAETLLYDGGLSGTDEDYIVAQHSPVSCDILVTARPTDDRTASPELLYLAGPQLVAVQDASDAPAPEALLARIDSAGATVIHTETHRSYVALLDSDPDSTITFKSVPASM
jgi:beta-lactamase superfamily II metal-dependent hydrolase